MFPQLPVGQQNVPLGEACKHELRMSWTTTESFFYCLHCNYKIYVSKLSKEKKNETK